MSNKNSPTFVCKNCGSAFSSWFGRCPDCQEWSSLVEFREAKENKSDTRQTEKPIDFIPFSSSSKTTATRTSSGISEFDRVLGGGFTKDEVVLISGEPGIGKSTLLLSIISGQAKDFAKKVVYISSEEGLEQIKSRADRIGINAKNLLFSSDKNIENVLSTLTKTLKTNSLSLVIFDSIQGLYSQSNDSFPGSISQAKEVLTRIVEWAKSTQTLCLVTGHITKDGEIAGPKFLEHLVDCVLFLEGDKSTNLRLLRTFKNRFGSVDEVGFFEMTEKGLQEVTNPSRYFLDWDSANIGKTAVGVRQGRRFVFATVESLVVSTNMAFPKRVAKGVDSKRLELLLAILKKYLHLPTDKFDVYVNISGGLRIDDPLADLGILAAVYSSMTGKIIPKRSLFIGEVGLLGNVRQSSMLASLEKEAKRLGFVKVYSVNNLAQIIQIKNLL